MTSSLFLHVDIFSPDNLDKIEKQNILITHKYLLDF